MVLQYTAKGAGVHKCCAGVLSIPTDKVVSGEVSSSSSSLRQQECASALAGKDSNGALERCFESHG